MKQFGMAWCAPYFFVLLFGVEAAQAQLSTAEQRLLQKLVLAEARSEGEVGMALVARATLNRAALLQNRRLRPGVYRASGRTLREVIMARGQYQPVSDGSLYARRTGAEHAQARRAIALARDTEALRARLRQAGESDAAIERLLDATGFRTGSAFNDASQNYRREGFGNHVFNGDQFSVELDVQAEFARRFEEAQPVATAAGPRRTQGAAARADRRRAALARQRARQAQQEQAQEDRTGISGFLGRLFGGR